MTTGRINQVALLRDAERRPWRAEAPTGRCTTVVRETADSHKGRGGASPLPHGMHWVREHGASARTTGPTTAGWNARGASASSGAPREGSRTESPFFMRIAPTERAGNTRAPRRDTSKATLRGKGYSEGDWPSTVRWTEHGASRRAQSGHHSYARTRRWTDTALATTPRRPEGQAGKWK